MHMSAVEVVHCSHVSSRALALCTCAIHFRLCPLLRVAVPSKFLLSAALFIWSYRFVPVQCLQSSTHVRLDLSFPGLPSSLPSTVLSRVS